MLGIMPFVSPQPRIRLATPDDAEAIAAIYAYYVANTPISFEVAPPSVDEMRARIERTLLRFPYLVCEVDARVVGYAYAGRHHERAAYDWSCEVSVYVENGMHRRGIGRALYAALLALLRSLSYYNALAGITVPNDGSVGLHTAMGFRHAGLNRNVGYKDGRWWDVAYVEMGLQEAYPEVVEPPLGIGDLKAEEIEAIIVEASRGGGRS
jgi:L-amino acid N-acyltransferase YncA